MSNDYGDERFTRMKVERIGKWLLIIGAIIMTAGIAYVVTDVLTGERPADTLPAEMPRNP